MGAASTAVSCVCASLSLPCPVIRPAVALGRFLTLDLVVRCSSTSSAEMEFWRPGTLCWSPVHSTLRRLENLSVFRGYGSGFLPPTAGRSFIGGTSAWSGPLLRVTAISLAFGLATAVFRCGGRPQWVWFQSWPLLDFPCCGFSAGLCRSWLASPSRYLSEYALSCHRLVSPRCGCV